MNPTCYQSFPPCSDPVSCLHRFVHNGTEIPYSTTTQHGTITPPHPWDEDPPVPHLSLRISRTLRVEVKERKVERKTAMKEESPMAKEWRRCSTSFSSVPAFTHCERETDLDCRRERTNQTPPPLAPSCCSTCVLYIEIHLKTSVFSPVTCWGCWDVV